MCLTILKLLRVATSESMIPRPCFHHCNTVYFQFCHLLPCCHFYYRITIPWFTIHVTHISLSLRRTSAPIQSPIVLGVLRTQENYPITTPSTIFWHYLLLIYFVKCFSGVAELTSQLLRLIGILWLPLCRINKLVNTYPQRLSRSLTVKGYQCTILA